MFDRRRFCSKSVHQWTKQEDGRRWQEVDFKISVLCVSAESIEKKIKRLTRRAVYMFHFVRYTRAITRCFNPVFTRLLCRC